MHYILFKNVNDVESYKKIISGKDSRLSKLQLSSNSSDNIKARKDLLGQYIVSRKNDLKAAKEQAKAENLVIISSQTNELVEA